MRKITLKLALGALLAMATVVAANAKPAPSSNLCILSFTNQSGATCTYAGLEGNCCVYTSDDGSHCNKICNNPPA